MPVPSPITAVASNQGCCPLLNTNNAIPTACTQRPPVISIFRPMRSLSGPVINWLLPHTPRYTPPRVAASATDTPVFNASRGSNPQITTSFKLLTSPPCDRLKKRLSCQLTRRKIVQNEGFSSVVVPECCVAS